ncbi:MAG: hypothetical protein Q4C47_05055, partial [Planctomycetia bacterium]|nr:hypothetical protein [Planctomycetia bacterium]
FHSPTPTHLLREWIVRFRSPHPPLTPTPSSEDLSEGVGTERELKPVPRPKTGGGFFPVKGGVSDREMEYRFVERAPDAGVEGSMVVYCDGGDTG